MRWSGCTAVLTGGTTPSGPARSPPRSAVPRCRSPSSTRGWRPCPSRDPPPRGPRPVYSRRMMPAQIAAALRARFGDRIIEAHADEKHPRVHVDAAHWREVAEHLRNDPALRFDWLANLSAIDYVG